MSQAERLPLLRSETRESVATSSGLASNGGGVWRKIGCVLLTVIAVGIIHGLLWHLHIILVPFVLSGFIVLSLQPLVEFLFGHFAGLRGSKRWFLCCTRRKTERLSARGASPRSNLSLQSSGEESGDGDVSERSSPLQEAAMTAEEYSIKAFEGLARFLSVSIVLSIMMLIIIGFFWLLFRGAMHMKDDWIAYQAGFIRVSKQCHKYLHALTQELHISKEMDVHLAEVYDKLLISLQDWILSVVNGIVQGISGGLAQSCIMLLYILFWLMEPVPLGGKTAGELVRNYLYLKTLVSLGYGIGVAILFWALGIDLAVLFGLIGFFLNFLPEIGLIISLLIPIPVIILDGRIEHPLEVLLASMVGQLFLKFIFSNIIEVKMYEKDKEMSIHPVWIILGLCYFGFIWGPAGMLLSVPLMAMMKTAAMSAQQFVGGEEGQSFYKCADSFLTCFEGDRGVHKYRGDTPIPPKRLPRSSRGDTNSPRNRDSSASGALSAPVSPDAPPRRPQQEQP